MLLLNSMVRWKDLGLWSQTDPTPNSNGTIDCYVNEFNNFEDSMKNK